MKRAESEHYIVEMVSLGATVKVSAICPKTMTEVSIVGPAHVGEESLKRTAIKKLEYVKAKKNQG